MFVQPASLEHLAGCSGSQGRVQLIVFKTVAPVHRLCQHNGTYVRALCTRADRCNFGVKRHIVQKPCLSLMGYPREIAGYGCAVL